jgi:serine/threonine protein kinase
MVPDYVLGLDLISVKEDQNERLQPEFLARAIRQIFEAVRYMHDCGVLHRDISPDNILVDDADNLTLIDFGAAEEKGAKPDRTQSTLIAVKDVYSPHELYLVTQFDKLRSDRDQARVLRRVQVETEGLFAAVYPVSLLEVLNNEEDVKAWETSGMAAFPVRVELTSSFSKLE